LPLVQSMDLKPERGYPVNWFRVAEKNKGHNVCAQILVRYARAEMEIQWMRMTSKIKGSHIGNRHWPPIQLADGGIPKFDIGLSCFIRMRSKFFSKSRLQGC